MTVQDWGSIGELVGGLAIIVSLLYVGLQIRQGTRASQSATCQAFSAQYAHHMTQLTRADFRDVFWRGLGGVDNLKDGEIVAFVAYMNGVVRMFETFYFQKQVGTFDGKLFESWMLQLSDVFGNKGARDFWGLRKHTYTDAFVDYIEREIAASTPKLMYEKDAEST